jgi:2,3-bisphosphoglycerate-independent phosphoglycerate mutase
MREETALIKGIRALYQEGQTDYSMEPLVLVGPEGEPMGRIRDGDSVIFCCRRGEREIQLTEAFVEADFSRFPRKELRKLSFVALTLYHEKFRDLPVAFAPLRVRETLGEVVSRHGLRQLRVAESEKFAHVTFFFNGGTHQPFPGEDDIQVSSPKGIAFQQVPELSLKQVTKNVVHGIGEGYDLTVVNFANGDVIGHVPQREARIKCVEALDRHLGIVLEAARGTDTVTLVTADHGILEEMEKTDGRVNAGHTSNPVPFVFVAPERPVQTGVHVRPGRLADVAPTVLDILGLPKPETMTGSSLVKNFFHDMELRGHPAGGGTAAGGKRRVLLVILDGWGLGREDGSNPIFAARTPVWDGLTRHCPWSRLKASGKAVGLKRGKMGNSEAGHMNLGAGRVVLQDDVRLDLALKDGSFYRNEVFLETMNNVRQRKGTLHLLALLSKKSSHGSIEYPLALLGLAKEQGLEDVCVHLILDGRSTEPGSAPLLLERFTADMTAIGTGRVVSCIGRGLALDRDRNYAKTRRAYEALVFGRGKACPVN